MDTLLDDVLMLWDGTGKELGWFMDELNQNTRNICLTFVVDPREISFLDLFIRLEGGKLGTQTFRKKMAANKLLYTSSHHPRPLVRGILVGQFLRIRRNCSMDDDFRREADDLFTRFRERGYSHRTLRRARKIAMERTRMDLL